MSGFVSNFSNPVFMPRLEVENIDSSCIEYIDNGLTVSFEQESAGFVGAIVGVVASIISYIATPAVLTTIAASTVISAGIAYANGARGGDVWRAAGIGALGGLVGGALGGVVGAVGGTTAGTATGTATGSVGGGLGAGLGGVGTSTVTGINAGVASSGLTSGVASGAVSGAASGAASGTAAGGATGTTVSSNIANGIRSMFGNVSQQTMNQIGAALVNAAVNGQSMGRMDGLVAQQLAELEALKASDNAAYQQRITAAMQVYNNALAMDPSFVARLRMGDIAGMEAKQYRDAMRNIATKQGGSLDAGQRKAYERSGALHTARSKALAYNSAYTDAQAAQNQGLAQASQLFGPNDAGMRAWQLQTDLRSAQERARRDDEASTWGGIAAGIFETGFNKSTSPDPSTSDKDKKKLDGFAGGFNNPFGGE